MDIFPRAADSEDMRTRRELITEAAHIAGISLAAPLITAAAPWVRLPDQHGTTDDEVTRLRAEVEHIAEGFALRPAPQVMAALVATWSNLDSLRIHTSELVALKAHVAIMAGANCVTLGQSADGHRWFTIAHISGRLAHDSGLISLAHSRAANAGLHFGDRPKDIVVDCGLALRHATTDAELGQAAMMKARTLAAMGQRQAALKEAEAAVSHAAPGASLRLDGWSTGQAHMMAGWAMADYPELLPAVVEHTRAALDALPVGAGLSRAHARLSVAQVRTRAREYEGAAQVIMQALDELGEALQPVHVTRVRQIAGLSGYQGQAMKPVRERLATLTA